MYGIIYCIENTINNHKYIGQTIRSLEERIDEHFNGYNYEFNKGRALYQAINKYGKDNFISYKIDEAENQEELDDKESYWIKYYNTFLGKGYNMTAGGQIEKKDHTCQEISDKISKIYGGKEFLIFDRNGNFIKSMVSQTLCSEDLHCCVQSVNNCLKGIKSQVKDCILIFKEEYTDEVLKERVERYNLNRKRHLFYVFDNDKKYIGEWDNEISCSKETDIPRCYIHKSLMNNNKHERKTKCNYLFYYIDNCPKYLLESKEECLYE